MDYSFSINSFKAYWSATQKKIHDYLNDNLNEELAKSCACDLWHLCDWYFKENKETLNYNQLSDLQGDYGAQCSALRIMRDICNGSKHAGLDRTNNPVIRKTNRHHGVFQSNAFQNSAFDVSVLEVELTNGDKVYFDESVEDAFLFWKGLIDPN